MSTEPTMPNEDLLSAYLDGECTDEEHRWVEQELASSAEVRAVLGDVRSARDAVRALPLRNAPTGFWAGLLAGTDAAATIDVIADDYGQTDAADPSVTAVPAALAAPVSLDERRDRRRPRRWPAAAGAAAAAAVVAVVVLMPQPRSVNPPVAAFTAAHAVRSSLQDDSVSSLAPLAVQAGFRR